MGDQILAITIPPGYGPGQQLVVQAPDGQKLQIIIPPGMTGGQQLQVAVPKAPAAPPAAPSMPRVPPAPSPPAGLKQLKKKAKVAAPEVEMTGALASAATNAKNVAAGDNEKQMDSLMLKARQLNVARYEVQEALEQAGGHVGQAFKALQKISDDKAAQLAATVGDGMSGPKKILRNAQYSHDPLGDLLKGDIETLPPIYSDQAQYFRELEKKLRQPVWQVADTGASDNPILRQDIYLDADATHNKLLTIPIYPDEIVIPKIDILQTSSVRASTAYINPAEERPIKDLLNLLAGDATCNVKMRALEENRHKLPSRVSRAQAEAILRMFEIPNRRRNALAAFRDRVTDEEWANEVETGSSVRIREVCGDPLRALR